MLKHIAILLFFCHHLVCQQSCDAVLANYKTDKELQHASYSFCVLDAATGKTLKEYNSQLALIPASTLKIITTSAALGILGKEFCYKTNFYKTELTDSTTNKSTINLVIKACGDPSFNSQYFYKNDILFLNELVTKLKQKHTKSFTGNVIVDNSVFDNQIPSTWIWGDIGNYFGAGATGLSYRDNKFSIFFSSGELNTNAKVETIVPASVSKKLSLTTDVKSFGTEDNAYVYGDPNGYTRFVSGTIPKNKTKYEVEAQLPEPARFFAEDLITELQKQTSVSKTARAIVVNTPLKKNKDEFVFVHQSPKLDKLIYFTNTKSDNHFAECLLNTIGTEKYTKQGSTQNGIDCVKKYWQDRGIDVSGLNMVDGSGLSRANTVTTKIQASILSKIYRDSLMYDAFNASLPIAGKNGSMVNLCKGTFAEGNMRAKTGYINRARAYCGYVKTKTGKELTFSVIVNNYDCSPKEMKLKIEKLLVSFVEL